MNFSKNNLIKILPIISSVCIFNGCVQKNADGTYPVTYSYHPYNKLYKSAKNNQRQRRNYNQRRKVFHTSYQSRTIYRPQKVYKAKKMSYRPKRVYHPVKHYTQRRPNHIQFPEDNFLKKPDFLDNNTIKNITQIALSQMGKTYVWGATGPFTFDCSGFTQFVYEQNGIELPRVSKEQAKEGKFIDKEHLQKGDLIFFSSIKSDEVHHVGIYLGDSRFVHASSAKKRVTISSLDEKYYRKHFKWGRRIIRPKEANILASN